MSARHPRVDCACSGRLLVGDWVADYPDPANPTRCETFVCPSCRRVTPFCQGGAPDERCDACAVAAALGASP